jgi:hypothetical protein
MRANDHQTKDMLVVSKQGACIIPSLNSMQRRAKRFSDSAANLSKIV